MDFLQAALALAPLQSTALQCFVYVSAKGCLPLSSKKVGSANGSSHSNFGHQGCEEVDMELK